MKPNTTDMEVMTAYLRNPTTTTEEISDVLEMSKWTVAKSRKRLAESGILSFIWVPDFRAIGAELLFSGFGSVKTGDTKKSENILPDTLFFSSFEDIKGVGIGMARDYTQFYEEVMDFSETARDLDAERYGLTILPMGITDIWRLVDFYPLISSEYGIEVPEIVKPHVDEAYSFREGEKEVYAELVEHPEWSGEKIAEKLGTSRQRVLRLREKFEKEGAYRKKAVVNLRKIGYEVMLFVSWRMRADVYRRMIEEIDKYPLYPIIFGASTPIQGIAIAVFKNFRKSREITAQLSSWANPEKNIMGEPDILFLSIPDTVFGRYFHFGRAVKRVLNI